MLMDRALARRLLSSGGAVAALALFAGTAGAQNAVFSGKVTSSGAPLGGASVGIPDLGVGAVTSLDGHYNFTVDVSKTVGRSVNVVARTIGFKPKRLPIVLAVGRVEKDFDLEKDVLNLEQIVVTGVSDATSQKKTPFSIAAVDASQLKDAPGTSPLASLSGKIAGASVVTVSGQPGSAPAIRLRAPTSISGKTDPLIIIDGTISRLSLADIASEDIERVEVIKGAAASSLYGSDAANGVVQIFTKRGASLAEGQTYFTLRNEYGGSYLPRTVPGNMSHAYKVLPNGDFDRDANGNRVLKADQISDNSYQQTFDQLGQVFKSGRFMTNYASVGERKGSTNFSASFQNTQESGVLDILSGFKRQNFRLNVDHALNDQIDLSSGAFYGRSHADQGEDTGIFFGLRFLEPNIDLRAPNKDGTPFNAVIKQPPQSGNLVNPLYGLSQRQISQDRDRFTGTFKARYRPTNWLTAESNVNYDESNQNYRRFRPLGFLSSAGAKDKGALFQQVNGDRSYNTGVTLTATKTWDWLTNTSKAAFVYEDQTNSYVNVNASALTVPKVTEFSAASPDPNTPVTPGSRTDILRAKNAFFVSTFEIKDRYILDGVVRRDESSLFGSKQRAQTYYRASGAYRLSEDFRIRGVDELKLRASYGTAGLRPIYDAQYETLAIAAGSPQKVTLGNPELKPAFSREIEVGFNLNFLTKFTVEYSYSDKLTTDQILEVPLSAAAGYRTQWQNAGTLAGNTHELAASALLLAKRDYYWRVGVTADRTRSKITALNVPPFLSGPDGNTQFFRVAEGETFGVIYGERWIKTAEQLATSIASKKISGVAGDYVKNEEGFYVLAKAKGTVDERPLKAYLADGSSLQQIGDVNPNFNLSFTNGVQWKSLTVNALVNWVKGGNIYNLTRQWPFNEERDPVFDQRGKPQAEKKPVNYYKVFYNGINANDYFVEDGSYVRLRELSVNWALPKSLAKSMHLGEAQSPRIGIVGRNLWTSTNYSGYDPDVSSASTNGTAQRPFGFRVDNFSYPAYRTFTVMLELGF
jgi:TonB-linked SusC/RagA family outer membrane protein